MNKKELIEILKPYWKKVRKIQMNYFTKLNDLEIDLNKKLKRYNLPKLSIFHVDGEPVGIGADNYSDRKNFELIHDSDLEC